MTRYQVILQSDSALATCCVLASGESVVAGDV